MRQEYDDMLGLGWSHSIGVFLAPIEGLKGGVLIYEVQIYLPCRAVSLLPDDDFGDPLIGSLLLI